MAWISVRPPKLFGYDSRSVELAQAVVFLSKPGVDHQGGEFLLVEQRPRAQSMGDIVPAQQGGLAVFTTRIRPVRGTRGYYRVQMRHGVTRVHQGTRFTLGIIFHDAR